MNFDLGIRCGHFLSMKDGVARAEQDRFIGVSGAKIAKIADWDASFQKQCKKFLDASAHVVLPGLVNAHTHLAMTLFRGFEDDVPFQQWLFETILPLESKLVEPEFVRTGTLLGAAESIRFGVTTVNDMYFFAGEIANTLSSAGLRACVAQVFSNFPLPEDKALGTDKKILFEKLFAEYSSHALITPALGPHAPYSCDDGIFKTVADLQRATQALIHVHVSETQREVAESQQQYKRTPVRRLFDLGVLNKRTVCAHMVHVQEEDCGILERSGAAVAHCPDSNLKLSAGIAPVAHYLKRKIPVALGTDGAASSNNLNVLGAMNIAAKLQKTASADNLAMTASQALSCATWGGARALGLGEKIGSLEEGKLADFIAVDLRHPHLNPVNDVVSHLVYAATGLEVDHVVCNGKILLENGGHCTIQTEALYKKADQWREKIRSAL